jgi:beta-galactosidase
VLVAASFYTAADDDLDFLTAYARAGGHLVVGPRTGYGDTEARARTERAPARIADAAGAWYDEMVSLPAPVPVAGSLRGAATGFAEGLVATDAEVLAAYQHRHLGRWAAVTTRAAGAGRITVVGTVPDQDLAAALVRWLVPDAVGGWTAGDSVTVSTSTDPTAGIRLHLVHNWSWEEATACATSAVTDLLEGRRYAPGEAIALGPWDVRLLRGDEAGDRRWSQDGERWLWGGAVTEECEASFGLISVGGGHGDSAGQGEQVGCIEAGADGAGGLRSGQQPGCGQVHCLVPAVE